MKPSLCIESRLSSNSTTASGALLALSFLLIGFTLFLAFSASRNWPYVVWSILLAAQQGYHAIFYQVSLSGNRITVARLFTFTSHYTAQEFTSLQQSNAYEKPMQISFTDGRSFAFSPKLKTSNWSIYSILPEVFIKHRTREIKRAASLTTAG
jgi:hypothetical protein